MTLVHHRTYGTQGRPAVILLNSLGTTQDMWQQQIDALASHFYVVGFDMRGHGLSHVPPGPYRIAQMGEDVLGLMDSLALARVHLCGLSLGGMVAQWLAAHHVERVDRLVLSNTAARIGTVEGWNARIEAVRDGGMEAIVASVVERWFTPAFQAQKSAEVSRIVALLRATPVEGYVASCAAIRDMDQRATVAGITAATLVIAGKYDSVTPLAEADFLAVNIANASLLTLPTAHLSNVEAAAPFTAAVLKFLEGEDKHGR